MTTNQVSAILTFVLLVIVTAIQACPNGWIYWSKSCYYRSKEAGCYSSAIATCHNLNATLVNINSEEENKFVYDTFVSKSTYRRSYIGVVREKSRSSKFVTSEGKPQKYFNWADGEPDNLYDYQDCVEMRQKVWNDISCGYMLPFICESVSTEVIFACNKTGNPCKNGGKCVDLPEGKTAAYKCACQHQFYGARCEHRFRGCAEGWIAFGHHCYRAFPGARPWHVAEIVCQKVGGDLPAVQSEEENAFLRKNFPEQNLWIGITECLCGKKCTVDFSKVRFSNWDTYEPKDLDEAKGCGLMEKRTGKWQNKDCKEKHNIVCKRESTVRRILT